MRGSHRHFDKEGVVEIINLQGRGRHAKPYQMKQLRQLVGCNPILVDQRVNAIDSGAEALSGGVLLKCVVLLGDTHGLHREIGIPDGDVLAHAVNFSSEGEAAEAGSFGEVFCRLPHRHRVAVVGNHAALASHEEMPGRNTVQALT